MQSFFHKICLCIKQITSQPGSKKSLFSKYSTYSWIGFFSLLTLILYASATWWFTSHNIQKWAIEEARQESIKLEKELKKLFHESEYLLTFIGKEILKGRPEDLIQIWEDAKDAFGNKEKSPSSFFWPTLGWISPSNLQIVNTQSGLLPEPIDMSIREYTQQGKEFPWKMLFAKSGPAYPPEMFDIWVIPVGMAIVNDAGELVGFCAGCYNSGALAKNLDHIVNNRSVNFLLLDNDGDIVVESPDTSVKYFNASSISTSYTKKIKDTPFTLVTYFSNEAIDNIFHEVAVPNLIKILTVGICLIFLVCFFLHGVINKNHELAEAKKHLEHAIHVAQNSDKAKEEFLRSVRQDLKVPFVTIVTYTEILLKQLRGEINLDLSPQKQIDFLNRIEQACQDLEKLTSRVVDLSNIDIKSILEECLIIVSKEAFIKGVTLESHILELPKWNTDELRFKQIIVGLLYHSLQFCRKGDRLLIDASTEKKEGKQILIILIKDNGIGLSGEEWHHIQTSYQSGLRISHFTDGTSLELPTVEQLVALLNGSCKIESTWNLGTEITLQFPYLSKEEFGMSPQNFPVGKSSAMLCEWGSEQDEI